MFFYRPAKSCVCCNIIATIPLLRPCRCPCRCVCCNTIATILVAVVDAVGLPVDGRAVLNGHPRSPSSQSGAYRPRSVRRPAHSSCETAKVFSQIADIPNSYILADDIDMPRGNRLPLWLLGFMYQLILQQNNKHLRFYLLSGANFYLCHLKNMLYFCSRKREEIRSPKEKHSRHMRGIRSLSKRGQKE